MRADILLQGGILLDGTGAEPIQADIAILNNRILSIGSQLQMEANRCVQLNGMHIAPGFIDIHTHSDISITFHPGQNSALGMGVTTQVVGNCGLSPGFAVDSDVFEFEKRWLAPHKARIRWHSFAEHLQQVEEGGVGTNYVPLAGHGTLRKRVMGNAARLADQNEMLQMQQLLQGAMEAGAWGLSSGLEYTPSGYADVAELTELCRVIAPHKGLYATHLRNEGDTLIESVQEAMQVARAAGVALQLSHHKAEGRQNWGKTKTTLHMVEEARKAGMDVQMDQYPYTAFMTSLAVQTLPMHLMNTPLATLADPQQKSSMREAVLQAHPEFEDNSPHSHWKRIQIGVCRGHPELQGRVVAELAQEAGLHPLDYVLGLLQQTEGFVSAVNFAIGEEDIARVLQYHNTSIGSDGVGTHPGGVNGADQIHPRTYGTFPRVLGHYVRELGILSETEAVRRMTSLPAARMGLHDRGVLRPGAYADLVVYNPNTISDLATFNSPHQYAQGIEMVIVNGNTALERGTFSTSPAGRVLRKSA